SVPVQSTKQTSDVAFSRVFDTSAATFGQRGGRLHRGERVGQRAEIASEFAEVNLLNLNLLHSQRAPEELSLAAAHGSLSRAQIAHDSAWGELGDSSSASSGWRSEIMMILD
ncbi:MAG: hypothetical protein SGJ20_21840, partial [Planctomycetota bacterium]|nr:hypothetical protein [Planctomycetota bacterium]